MHASIYKSFVELVRGMKYFMRKITFGMYRLKRSQHSVSGIRRVRPSTKFLQVQCAKDADYTASVVITM